MHLIVQLQRQIPVLGDMGCVGGDTKMPHTELEVEPTSRGHDGAEHISPSQTVRGMDATRGSTAVAPSGGAAIRFGGVKPIDR